MKIPNKIATITELVKWIDQNNPTVIEIDEKSKVKDCLCGAGNTPFPERWKRFRDIPLQWDEEFIRILKFWDKRKKKIIINPEDIALTGYGVIMEYGGVGVGWIETNRYILQDDDNERTI